MTQSLACVPCGVPVRRGPIESKNVCARSHVWELSIPSVHIRLSTGSFVAVCAETARHGTTDTSTLNAKERMRVMRDLRLRIELPRALTRPACGVLPADAIRRTRARVHKLRKGGGSRWNLPHSPLRSSARLRDDLHNDVVNERAIRWDGPSAECAKSERRWNDEEALAACVHALHSLLQPDDFVGEDDLNVGSR